MARFPMTSGPTVCVIASIGLAPPVEPICPLSTSPYGMLCETLHFLPEIRYISSHLRAELITGTLDKVPPCTVTT